MNDPNESSDRFDLARLLPDAGGTGESAARLRLWRAMDREYRETQRRRFLARSIVMGLTLFGAWLAVPVGLDGGSRELFGLADALAGSEVYQQDSAGVWYERSERLQHVVVDPSHLRPIGLSDYSFDVSVVVERWIAVGGAVRTLTTYGTPQFAPGVDSRVFDLLRLGDRYPVMRAIETLGVQEPPGPYTPPWQAGVEGIGSSMRTQVQTTGDSRPDFVAMLDLTIQLLRQERDDPLNRGLLLRVLAGLNGLQFTPEEDAIVVSARYVVDQEAFEQRVVLDSNTGGLVSYSVERLATWSSSSHIVESHHFSRFERVEEEGNPPGPRP